MTSTHNATPGWVRAVPFFLPAFFFLSALFSVVAPLPLLFLRLRAGSRWAWGAGLVNTLIVYFALGPVSTSIFVAFIVTMSLVLGELLARKVPVERALAGSLLGVALIGFVILEVQAAVHHVAPIPALRAQASAIMDTVLEQASSGGNTKNMLGDTDPEDWKRGVMLELPSAVAVFSLILAWLNFVVVFRLNPGGWRSRAGLDPGYLSTWRSPDWMVWPAIAAGFFLLWDAGWVSTVALNVFRFLMAIYAIQGLSVIGFFFDHWKVRAPWRGLAYIMLALVMTPLLLSVGFFDLWFDFRAKFRQKSSS